jgi:hypothetical protein
MAIHEFRPDILNGLLTCCAIVSGIQVLLQDNEQQQGGWFRWPAIFFGAALLTKPSAAPFTVIIVTAGYGMALAAILLFHISYQFRSRLVQSIQLLVSGILLASPYYLINGKRIFQYTYNAVVRDRAIWAGTTHIDAANWTKQLLFYTTGSGGKMMLGGYFMLAIINIIAAAFIVRREGRTQWSRFLVLLLVTLLAWLIPSLSIVKTQFLAATFYCLLIILSFMSVRIIYASLLQHRSRHAATFLVVVVVLALFSFKFPPSWGKSDGQEVVPRVTLFNRMVDDLDRGCNEVPGDKCTIGILFTGYINRSNIEYALRKKGHKNIAVISHFLRPEEDVEKVLGNVIKQSTYVIVAEPGTEMVNESMPLGKILDTILTLIRTYPSHQLVQTYASHTHRNIYLYRKEYRESIVSDPIDAI